MDLTPLDKLNNAVHEYWRALQQEDNEGPALVTGWVIGFSTVRFHAEDTDALPEITGMQYAIGPQTSVAESAGLTQFLRLVHERVVWQMLDTDD